MPNAPRTFRPHHHATKRPPDHRPNAYRRGYTKRWQRARLAYLQEHPLCVECLRQGRTTEATVVDHIIPHRGDYDLFWAAETNWQALCERHHNAKSARGA